MADMKRRLIAAWSSLHQRIVDEVMNQWRDCARANGQKHFEHLLCDTPNDVLFHTVTVLDSCLM